jgi:hypothetical protein
MIDALSIVIGVVIGVVFTASVYEIYIKSKVRRLHSIIMRASKVDKDIEDLSKKIDDLKNKKGGK